MVVEDNCEARERKCLVPFFPRKAELTYSERFLIESFVGPQAPFDLPRRRSQGSSLSTLTPSNVESK